MENSVVDWREIEVSALHRKAEGDEKCGFRF